MKARMILAVGTLATLMSSSAFAEDAAPSGSADSSKLRLAAQFEVLPLGSAKASAGGVSAPSQDTALAYGVSAALDYAVMPYLSIGLAPRLVFNVKADDSSSDSADKELDLRARVQAHFPVTPGLEVFAALTPGYTVVLSSEDGVSNATGFAIGGSVGLTYDVSPKMFLTGEVGYQRAFTSADVTVGTQKMSADLDLSYMNIGVGAGTRF